MLRFTKPILLAVLGLGGVAGASVPGVLRSRIQATLRDRCRAQGGATCQVGRLSLAVDGILLEDLRFQSRSDRVQATLGRVAVPLNWARLILGREQRLEVRATGIELRLRGSVSELRTELGLNRPRSASARKRFVLQHLDLQQLHVVASSTLGALALSAELTGAEVSWSRGDNASVQWNHGHINAGRSARLDSGNCLLVATPERRATIDCAGFDATVQSEWALADLSSLRSLRSLRPENVEQALDDANEAAPALDLRAHQGRVRLRHHDSLLLDLSPVVTVAHLDDRAMGEVETRFGAAGENQASLGLRYARSETSWRVSIDAASLPLRDFAPWVPGVPWHNIDRGVAHTRLRLAPTADRGVVSLDGTMSLQGFGVEHRMLAREALDGLEMEVRGRALIDLDRRRLASTGLDMQVNGIPFVLAGWAERLGDRLALDTSIQLPDVGCDAVRRALPDNAVGPVQSMVFTGTLGADVHIAVDSDRPQSSSLDLNVRDGCQVLRDGMAASLRRFSGPFVQRVQEPGGVLRAFVTGPGAPAWVPLASMSPMVAGAVITREDGAFYRHHGFSPEEIRGAFVRNVTARRFAFGASTITMQLVKNVFLAREKTLVRKLQEVALTWWIEQSLDKDSILELYLNVVEFGPGIYGIGPASRFFFAREPRELTPLQAIYLSTLLPAPVPRFVNFERGSLTTETTARLRQIARSMVANHRMSPEEFAAAATETLSFRPRRAPIPGAQTLNIDPNSTDEDAARLVETLSPAVRVLDDPLAPAQPEDQGAGPSPFIPNNDITR